MQINLISIFIKNIFNVTYNLGREHEETDNVAKGRSQGLKPIRRPPNEQAPVILEVTAKRGQFAKSLQKGLLMTVGSSWPSWADRCLHLPRTQKSLSDELQRVSAIRSRR